MAMTKYWQMSLKEERAYLGLGLKVQPIVMGEEGRRSVRQLVTLYSQSEREREREASLYSWGSQSTEWHYPRLG